MIDLQNETILSIPQAAKRVPSQRNGAPTHASTVLRWILKGVKGVRLEGARMGGRWVTSVEAMQRFSAELTKAKLPQVESQASSRSDQQAELVERELDALGL
jgi:hypothetical protein